MTGLGWLRNLAEMHMRRGLGKGPCIGDSYGALFVDEVRPVDTPNEIVLTKHRFSGFWGTSIDLILRSNGIKTLVMTGIVSEVCVNSTARDGFFRDYDVVVAGDCAASFSKARHDACHSLFARSFGVVAPSSDIANAWQNSNTIARGWQLSEKKQIALKTLEERVTPNHTALVLFGMENSGIGSANLKKSLPCIKAVLDQARRVGLLVIHIQSDYGQHVLNVGSPGRYRDHSRAGEFVRTLSAAEIDDTWEPAITEISSDIDEQQFMDGFKPLKNEPIVVKHRFSAFCDTDLEMLLRSNGVRTVVMMGQDQDCCLDTTAREATMKDYYLVVPEDCVVDEHDDTKRREVNLETLRRYFGLVCASQKIVAAWSESRG